MEERWIGEDTFLELVQVFNGNNFLGLVDDLNDRYSSGGDCYTLY